MKYDKCEATSVQNSFAGHYYGGGSALCNLSEYLILLYINFLI